MKIRDVVSPFMIEVSGWAPVMAAITIFHDWPADDRIVLTITVRPWPWGKAPDDADAIEMDLVRTGDGKRASGRGWLVDWEFRWIPNDRAEFDELLNTWTPT